MTAVGASVARPLDHRKKEPGSFFKERGRNNHDNNKQSDGTDACR